ncbi:MAG: nucleoside deaminase [Clostridium sp.]|uniref:nucleoside deaminase n=1 Tax=Clostridium sp. DSM 8431 TaxID=1761781 RepID=UPI0008E4C9E7|nr:nucleoside deaminase [Clostridium sp. DSM 8431]MCR4943265.1 nucleoside deaminase [Clostridium sp.]SFU90149.1 tRNA(adenine34) deaminase [Clostridium sp. DSM 8431]
MNYMEYAIEEGLKAFNSGEIPVGAIIVKNGIIIGKGYNKKETKGDPTAHAEIIAIKEACKSIGDWRLNGCEMYVTLEPCPMCTGAIIQSRISKLYIGTFNKDMGACGSVINLIDNRSLNSFVNVQWEYNEECSKLMTSFFENRRKR